MLLKPKTERHMQKKLEGRKKREKFYYDRGAKDLKELRPGDVVRMKIQDKDKEWVKAKVAEKVDPRSLLIRCTELSAAFLGSSLLLVLDYSLLSQSEILCYTSCYSLGFLHSVLLSQ